MRYRFLVLATLISATVSAQDKVDNNLLMGYLQEQQYDQVIRYMETTVQPQHPNGLVILANALYQNMQLPEAAIQYRKILTIAPDHITAHQQLGNIAIQQQQYATAVPHFQKLTEVRPGQASYWKQLARACTNVVGLQDSARVYMEKAYHLQPYDPGIVSFMADEYMGDKEFAKADSVLNKYYMTDSANISINAMLVKSSYNLNKYADAVRFGSQILEQRSYAPMAYMYLSVTYYHLKQFDSCIKVYDVMTEMLGDAPETVKFYAAMSYAGIKYYEKSNVLLLECISTAKSKSLDSYYAALAGNFEQMKQYRAAISYYDTAYYLFKDPMRQYGIARIYDQQIQDPQRARKHYQLYLKSAKPESKNEKDIHTYVKERVKTLQ
ncbi:tetratricopeptide repeat protein [Chitinophaga deserti]|uniref:tetratricopeptide repeat protein n=1 Tax=Chitinophaga deserti TaxID=2164099 RepID=UPI000D6AB2F7|nr:tetratricopeptide repeat protein [Chitinophaga deserti]